MNDKFKTFEKTFLMSKKFVAFFLTLAVLAAIAGFIVWKTADAGNISMWTACVLIADIVCLSFVSLAYNVSQAKLDSAVRLATVLGDKFPTDKLKNL